MSARPNPNRLYDKLQGQLVTDDVERIKGYLHNNPLAPSCLEKCDTSFSSICRELDKLQNIKPADLDFHFLEEMFEFLGMRTLNDIIRKFVAEEKSRIHVARKDSSGDNPPSFTSGGLIGPGNFPAIHADSVTINQNIYTPPTDQD